MSRLLRIGTTYAYDAAGNRRSVESPSGDVTTYAYDLDNQLVQVEDGLGVVATYTYNALQQRVGRDVDGDVTQFLWDGQNLRQESQAGIVEADYTVAPQPEPQPYGDLVSQRREMESSFYHFDALGSARALTDAGETVTDEATYKAFGETAAASGTTANPFGWVAQSGYYRDEETGLLDLDRRKHDPVTGAFTTEDPLGFEAESNFYRYVGNNPATRVDPSGLQGHVRGERGPTADQQFVGLAARMKGSLDRLQQIRDKINNRLSSSGEGVEIDDLLDEFEQSLEVWRSAYRKAHALAGEGRLSSDRLEQLLGMPTLLSVGVPLSEAESRQRIDPADRRKLAERLDASSKFWSRLENAVIVADAAATGVSLASGAGTVVILSRTAIKLGVKAGGKLVAQAVVVTVAGTALGYAANAVADQAGISQTQRQIVLLMSDIVQLIVLRRKLKLQRSATTNSKATDEAVEDVLKESKTTPKETAPAIDDAAKVVDDILATKRPTWRQSELDVGSSLEGQGYKAQKSFKGGEEVPYGTKDSVRPEYYKDGMSVEVKNYDVHTSRGRSNLIRKVTGQAKQRATELPKGARQYVQIDVRGQEVSRQALNDLRATIAEKSNGALKLEDITFIR